MNNVFLTSQASEVLERITDFLPKEPSECRVLVIPTAAQPYASAPWLEKDVAKLTSLGFIIEELDLKGATIEDVRTAVASADIIFVGGGNAFYLLEHAKKSGFIEIVREAVSQGKIYIGSSAGSVLAAPDIKYVELFDDPSAASIADSKALDLVDFRIVPHFGNPKYAELHEKVLSDYQSGDSRLIPTKDNEFLLQNGDLQGVGTP